MKKARRHKVETEIIKINPLNPEEVKIRKAAEVIIKGGLVVIPTETVYGIAANSTDKRAVQRLYNVKQRLPDKPFSLHIAEKEEAEKYAQDILPSTYRLIEKFWPGPLTLVLKDKEKGKIGIRMPNHKVALEIIKKTHLPIVCPSANLSGRTSPVTIEEALKDLGGLVDLAIDCGRTPLGKESTVIDATQVEIKVLREGALAQVELEKVASKKTVLFICTGNSCRSVMAKGILEKRLNELGREDDIEILSAGMMPALGLGGATPETKELLKNEDIDVSGHRSEGVTEEMLHKSDIILVMEKAHEERVVQLAPEVKNRVFLLKEFARIDDNLLDIPDPIGKTKEFYSQTFLVIKEAVERIAQII